VEINLFKHPATQIIRFIHDMSIISLQNNRLIEKTDKTKEKLTEKTEPKLKTD
jgi:hypothetical protein